MASSLVSLPFPAGLEAMETIWSVSRDDCKPQDFTSFNPEVHNHATDCVQEGKTTQYAKVHDTAAAFNPQSVARRTARNVFFYSWFWCCARRWLPLELGKARFSSLCIFCDSHQLPHDRTHGIHPLGPEGMARNRGYIRPRTARQTRFQIRSVMHEGSCRRERVVGATNCNLRAPPTRCKHTCLTLMWFDWMDYTSDLKRVTTLQSDKKEVTNNDHICNSVLLCCSREISVLRRVDDCQLIRLIDVSFVEYLTI